MTKTKISNKDEKHIFSVGVIIVDDQLAMNIGKDESGYLLNLLLMDKGFDMQYYIVISQEMEQLQEALVMLADELKVEMVLTLGGIGFKKKDITPQATAGVIEREVPGISEALRYYGLQYSSKTLLSRGISGIRRQTLIVNLPEDVKEMKRAFEATLTIIKEALQELGK